MTKEELKAQRKKMIMELKSMIGKDRKPEDFVFHHHPNEDHIVLSHALFWVMTKPLANKFPHNKCFLLLRQYQEEMLEAYLTEDESFNELLEYCNILYDSFPYVMNAYAQLSGKERQHRKLQAIAVIAGGFGGDMATDKAYDLLDDIDFNRYGKVVCPEIERMLPMLNKMVEEEMKLDLYS